jgi:hypothetical protein
MNSDLYDYVHVTVSLLYMGADQTLTNPATFSIYDASFHHLDRG